MKLTNGIITIEVAGHGAELSSLVKEGREYMWNGDSKFWGRKAPILFPAVGRPYCDEIHIGGKAFTMKQHGFARDCEFEEVGEGLMRMAGEGRPDIYPYRYVLEVQYSLDGDRVEVAWTVKNLDSCEMFAQIGAHPGFMLPDYDAADAVHGYVRYYDKEGRPISPVMVSGLDGGNRVPLADPVRIEADMPVTGDSFAHDALIFEGGQVAEAVLCDRQGRPVLGVDCPQAEAYGIWAPYKPGCPFICLEPWCGICDRKGYDGDISGRDLIHRIEPGGKYTFTYSIKVY